MPRLPGKVDTVIGMRRSGKTWFMYQAISDLLAAGTTKESILYLNMEDERLLPMNAGDLQKIPDAYYCRYPHLRDQRCTWFFDEIQDIDGWERFVRRLLDTENLHICLTGSSAKLLSREIATSLRGRSITTEVFPFSFLEALSHQGIGLRENARPGAKTRSLLENRMQTYLLDGGFPEVQGMERAYRIRILQEYVDVVIFRDLVERHQVSNIIPLRYMIRHMLNATATLFSVNKFYNDLKSQGVSCSKNTLHEYLDYLSDAYLFFQVFLHSRSERTRMVNPRKIYAVDPGLAQAYSRRPDPDWGHLLENFVFLELRRLYGLIEYYRTSSRKEVDFLVTGRNGERFLFQVAAAMDDASTRKRELDALSEAMQECKLRKATIVTLSKEEYLETEYGAIHVLPAWLWAISV